MRLVAFVVLILSTSGCAAIERRQEAAANRKQAQIEAKQEAIKKREAQEKLGAGSTIEEVRYAWDEPDYEELKSGRVIWRYVNAGDPMAFEFTDGKLTGYYRDDALAAKLERSHPRNCTSSPGWFGRTHTVCQ